MHDYVAQSLKNVESNIAELSQFEQEISSIQDKDKKQQLRRQVEQTRADLLGRVDASMSYLYLSTTQIANADEYRSVWQKQHPDEFTLLKEWGIEPLYQTFWKTPLPDVTILPAYSFILQFRFKLIKPYISRNDNDFYIIDNPLVRDKIFQLPMVRPTAWKGSLQAALWQLGYDKEKNDQKGKQAKRIFGLTNSDTGTAGRLFFYPTFFHKVDLEVINPHDRKTGVGARGPILIECVPEKSEGGFFLLYVPFDRIGQDETETRRQAIEDLRLTAQGIQAMMTEYGFGAKTSSGFGLANVVENGQLVLNAPDERRPSKPALTEPLQPETVSRFLEQYPDEDFQRKPQAWRKAREATNREQKRYMEVRAAYQAYQKQRQAYEEAMAAREAEQPEPAPQVTRWEFGSFGALVAEIAKLLPKEEGGR